MRENGCRGKITGKGRLVHSSGDYYEGEWYEDKCEGFGKYVSNVLEGNLTATTRLG